MNNASDVNDVSEEEREKQQRAIEMEITILEADAKKFVAEEDLLKREMRELEKDIDRIRVVLKEKKEKYEKADQEIVQNGEEVKRLRKKLNLL